MNDELTFGRIKLGCRKRNPVVKEAGQRTPLYQIFFAGKRTSSREKKRSLIETTYGDPKPHQPKTLVHTLETFLQQIIQ